MEGSAASPVPPRSDRPCPLALAEHEIMGVWCVVCHGWCAVCNAIWVVLLQVFFETAHPLLLLPPWVVALAPLRSPNIRSWGAWCVV